MDDLFKGVSITRAETTDLTERLAPFEVYASLRYMRGVRPDRRTRMSIEIEWLGDDVPKLPELIFNHVIKVTRNYHG